MLDCILRDGSFSFAKPNDFDFDPRWLISAFFNMGSRHTNYVSRGKLIVPSGGLVESQFVNTNLGRGYTSNGSTNFILDASAGFNFSPNTVAGSFIGLSQMSYPSSTPPAGASSGPVLIDFVQYTGGTWVVRLADQNGGNVDFGWYNNGVNSLVSVAKAGLWNSGDLVLFGFSYSSAGTRAFINGKLVASSGTAPSTYVTSSHSMNLGIGNDPNFPGQTFWNSPIYYAAILDRALADTEWLDISARPFEWMYAPRSFLPALTPAAAIPSGILQTAVSM